MMGRTTTTTTSLLMVGNRGIIGEPWAAIRWTQARVMGMSYFVVVIISSCWVILARLSSILNWKRDCELSFFRN